MRLLLVSVVAFSFSMLASVQANAQSSVPAPVSFSNIKGKTYRADDHSGQEKLVKFDEVKQLLTLSQSQSTNVEKIPFRLYQDKVILGKNNQYFTFSTSRDTIYLQPSGVRYIKVN